MKTLTLTLRDDAYGNVCTTVTIMTSKPTEELSDFIDQFFDISENKNMHGYRAKSRDGYKIVEYLKKKFKYSDDEMIITKPEVIERYY